MQKWIVPLWSIWKKIRCFIPDLSNVTNPGPTAHLTATKKFELPDTEDRFSDNSEFQDCVNEFGLFQTLDQIPMLRCELNDQIWAKMENAELFQVIYTESARKDHWPDLRKRAFAELIGRPDSLNGALFLCVNQQEIEEICGDSCFIGMFQRIISEEPDLQVQKGQWELVLEKTTEHGALCKVARETISQLEEKISSPQHA